MTDTSATPTVQPDQVAAPGPHPHDSADFKDWHGVDSTGHPTAPGGPAEPEAEQEMMV